MMFIEVWWIFAIFYFVFFWGIPMLGMLANKWTNEAEGEERSKRYWYGVRFFSLYFHLAAIIVAAGFKYILNPMLTGA